MRIKVAIAILLLAGTVLTVFLLVDNRILSPAESENVRAVCSQCHGLVPQYDSALQVHNKHAAFDCGFCHSDIGGLKTADSVHTVLKWLGIGTLSLALTVVVVNFLVSSKKKGGSQ